jgi:hypothetical protein
MKGELRVEATRPVEEVFDFLADIRNEVAWNPRVISLEKTSSGPIAAGTTFRGRYQGLGPLETELIEYERPARLGFRSIGPRMRLAGTFTLTATQHGASVVLVADLQPQGIFKLLEPLMAPMLKRQNAAAAARLKQALEQPRARPMGAEPGRGDSAAV